MTYRKFIIVSLINNCQKGKIFINQEQYSRTLFLRNTSKSDLRARVSGNHPGTLISKFLRAAS